MEAAQAEKEQKEAEKDKKRKGNRGKKQNQRKCVKILYRQRKLTRTSVRSVVSSMMKMSFKMLGSDVTTMTVEGRSITVPGCQIQQDAKLSLTYAFTAKF